LLKRLLCLAACVAALAGQSFGWGAKGHKLSARVAVKSLPDDMPDFFRKAGERLVYLCPEPDRWRTMSTEALYRLNGPDHYLDLEQWGSEPLPPSRYGYILQGLKRGIIKEQKSERGDQTYLVLPGTAPYAVAEMCGKLITDLRIWRDSAGAPASGPAAEAAGAERAARQALEEAIIYLAGVMGHYVTDLGNPLHCTVHHNGWAAGYPNPNGFAAAGPGQRLHSRFESEYVDRVIFEKDIAERLPAGHRIQEPVKEMEQFLRRNQGFVEELYSLEEKGSFGSGSEPPEAQAFTAQRLADAAGMLRDVWHTAWLVSGEEWLNDRVFVYVRPGRTVLEILREELASGERLPGLAPERRLQTERTDAGEQVVAIGNRKNGLDRRQWRWYLDGQLAAESPDKHVTAAGERIEFRFERP
jgi:hypothetical protein